MDVPTWLHHVSLHAPLVAPLMLGALGLAVRGEESASVQRFIRVVGWLTLLVASVAVVAGLLATPDPWNLEKTPVLRDHRDLGITAWCLIAVAAWAYEQGCRQPDADWRRFAIGAWWTAALAAIGAGHWGGLNEHAEIFSF